MAIELPWFIPSEEAQKERERILASKFFLVKIAGNGEVWRCRRCKNKHRYLTLMCIEQPFSGITGGLYAYYKTFGLAGAEQFLSPLQRSRYDKISAYFQQEDLSKSHPQTARSIVSLENEVDVGAFAIGLLEPIGPKEAAKLVNAINLRGLKPPLVVPGL